MYVLLIFLLLTTSFFGVFSFSAAGDKKDDVKVVKDVCMSDSCKSTAERIINYMDSEIKPCDDFYQFTCGQFLRAGIPKGKSSVSPVTQLQDVVNSQLREILEAPAEPGDNNAIKASKKFYALCIQEANSQRNLTESKTLVHSVGWPVIGAWREENWSIFDQENKFRNLTLSGGSLFHVAMEPDMVATTTGYLVTLDQPKLTRRFHWGWEEQKELADSPYLRAYLGYMVDTAVMLGADRQTAEHQLRDSLLFELELEEIIDMPNERNRAYELMTVAELQERAGWVDWMALLAANVASESLNADHLVKVYEPGYLDRLGRLIQKHTKRTIANFLGWRTAEWLSMTTPEMDARRREFSIRAGLEDIDPSKFCLDMLASTILQLAVSAMYVRKYITEESQSVVSEIASDLQDQMNSVLKAQDWMEDNTKTNALLKLCRMKKYIGYPNELTNNKTLDAIFDGLDLDQAPDFRSLFNMIYMWGMMVGNRRTRYDWVRNGFVTTSPNAFYKPRDNLLHITAAFLQAPIFRASLPKYIYYSTVGIVAGHEITHGFDNNGLEFDADGNSVNWLDDSSKMNFAEKSKCFLNQYTKYLAENLDHFKTGHLPYYVANNRSLGEIIADYGGLKLAYNAFQKYSAQLKEPEPSLPDLEQYTREQMFFIGFGNLFCSNVDIKAMQKTRTSDEHPPGQFRINRLFQNFPHFSEAFNCAAESNMNPKEKCSIW